MAEIRVTATSSHNGGPSLTRPHFACIGRREWPGGGTVPVLRIFLGADTVEVWPADAGHIRQLGERLVAIAAELEAEVP